MTTPSTPPPNLDPPFRGYIESTFDALLVFEAARRGMIPRVTRRLIERERGMVQSGAVFVFDEHESGIKRWTDGLVWSPSRILGNFLVYRETDKRSHPATPSKDSNSPPQDSPTGPPPHTRPATASLTMSAQSQSYDSPQGVAHMQPSVMDTPPSQHHLAGTEPPPLGQGALARPRSASEGGGPMDRQRERQLVGSLTNSYKFKESGLVKKTMSVSVNGFAQHMVSYYSVEDVLSGKLRAPSTIPELASLEISAEYLHKQNFRFPPMIEIGADGVPRYRGEAEEPASPTSPTSAYSFQGFPSSTSAADFYDGGYPQMTSHAPRMTSPRNRSATIPMPIPMPPHAQSLPGPGYIGASSSGPMYESPPISGMHYAPPVARQNSHSSIHSSSGAVRPGSSSRRYDPYGSATSPRLSGGLHYAAAPHRRQSQPFAPEHMYQPPNNASYDIKPNPSYNYHPPSTAPSTFSTFYPPNGQADPIASPITSPTTTTFAATPTHGYAAVQPLHGMGSGSTSRLIPTTRSDYNAAPPSSSGSSSSGGRPGTMNGGHQTVGHDSWTPHAQSHMIDTTNGWDGGHPTSAPQSYIQPIHQQHDDWARPNTGAIA